MSLTLIPRLIATEIGATPAQVVSAVELLDGGATVPFIARYRKEVTGGLDDTQLRKLEERLGYLRELEARRAAILASITEQGKLTEALAKSVAGAVTKAELEDIYLPYKPKRRTKAMIAREAGLQGLLDAILANRGADPVALAGGFLSEGFPDAKAALEGARDILAEGLSEDASLLGRLRDHMRKVGKLAAKVVAGKETAGAKFSDYFAHTEDFSRVPSHRALAMFRGRNEEVLTLDLEVDADAARGDSPSERACGAAVGAAGAGPGDKWLREAAAWAWRVKIRTSLTLDLMAELGEAAEAEAIRVFARNLKDLLLAAPAGGKATMGLDPGIRTGVKVAVVDATGKVVATDTVYPFQPRMDLKGAQVAIARLIGAHGVKLISIGNGTASRETEKLVGDLLALLPGEKPVKVIVSEAGASVYSASELAAREFPELDVSLRGAVSIARRLQDPLAELVKIDPKSIGVGQYQHDVNQSELARSLETVVEDCVNSVGVDLNTASVPLLSRVSGLSGSVAKAVVRWREANGAFKDRQQLMQVTGLGAKTFEQSAGFLRIRGGENPLDMTGVHPETYSVVENIIGHTRTPVGEIMGRADMLKTLKPELFANEKFGVITVKDIITELEKPGRDPRPDFKVARFNDGVEDIKDLKEGMVLEGTVSNVAAFGAFIDLGVHQDGLVHVSQLSHKFVTDAREVVKTGDIVKVQVVEVDVSRKRIALTMKLGAAPARRDGGDRSAGDNRYQAAPQGQRGRPGNDGGSMGSSAMASAFAKLKR